jgi:ubiquitin-conjugating enzyme E2 C
MNYDMEDTQNSAPGSLPAAQASKLGAPRKGPDAHSTTKRLVSLSPLQILTLTSKQLTNGVNAIDDLLRPWHLRLSIRRWQSFVMDCDYRGTRWYALRRSYLQTLFRIPLKLSVRRSHRSFQDTYLPPKCRFLRQNLPGYSEGQMDCRIQYPNCAPEFAKFTWRTKQVGQHIRNIKLSLTISSASPLKGEAAELWDKDPEEFKKKVLGRHRDIDDE